jgi:hypothetical protein
MFCRGPLKTQDRLAPGTIGRICCDSYVACDCNREWIGSCILQRVNVNVMNVICKKRKENKK